MKRVARGAKQAVEPGLDLPFEAKEVALCLLAWYGRAGRALPWRNTRDPYRVWLSEIMLQQTTVAAVIPYYERFLAQFPTVAALAAASIDEVLGLWAGLGYYSRARNLHGAAGEIVTALGGRFPETAEGLTALPGIGRSTAGAILSIAFDKPAAILDGNVRRVLVRLFAWLDDPRSSAAEKQLWRWAAALTPADRPHDYAQAIMDLGATVCTPRQPDCGACPLQHLCQANRQGLAAVLPKARKPAEIPVRQQVALAISSRHGLLLRQRPIEGFLGGLWEFPAVDLPSGLSPDRAAHRLLADLGLCGTPRRLGEIRHAYSHFKLELTLFMVDAAPAGKSAELTGYRWCRDAEMATLPVHGAHKKAYGLCKHK